LAQRVTRRAARLEALVLVTETGSVRGALVSFYEALGLPFRPGCVADLPVGMIEMVFALCEEVRARYGAAREGEIQEETLVKARADRERWRYIPETGSSL
jgi:hypothetical protein